MGLTALIWVGGASAGELDERLVDMGMVEQAYAGALLDAAAAPPEERLAAELHAGSLLWEAERWDLAAIHFRAVPDARLAYGYSLYREGQHGAALLAVEGLDEGHELAGFAALHLDDVEGALQHWQLAGATSAMTEVQGWGELPHRRPGVAAGLSAVLPGAGQAYVGRWGEAGSALIVNTMLIGSTAALLRREEYFAGVSVGLLALSFYGGNIMSARWGAHRFNRRAREERLEALGGLEPRYRIEDGELIR